MASNFPGLKDPRRQSRLGRLADRDVELGHAREWSRERLAAARRAEDEAATYKAATRRDIAGATESTGLGRAPSDALRENLEKALVKPSLLGMTAPLSLSVPTTTAGKVIGGGIGAALGGIGGEDPYFSALSMLHPTLAMAQMANVAYRDEPILPISDAHGAKFPFLSKQGIQRLLNHYAYGMAPEASKAALGRVSASDFLNATVPGEESLARIVKRTGGRYDPYWEGRSSHPMLYLDDDGRIIGHEGRHRIAGLSQAVGENVEVPVVFRRYSRSSPEDFEAIPRMVPGQQFESGTGMPFVRENLTPISYANEGALSKYLTEFDVPLTKLRVGLPGDMPEIPANTNPLKFAGGGSVAGAAKRLTQRAMSQAGDVDPVVAPRGALSVIKNKGGNWLTGSVEDALKGLKRPLGQAHDRAMFTEEMLADPRIAREVALRDRESALNNFIDKQLTRYVKNEMATPEDPIRALAERGILHVPQQRTSGYYLTGNRAAGGFPEEGLAKNELARGWEYMTDVAINPLRAKDFFSSKTGASRFPSTTEANPWLSKVAPETPVYEQLYATTGPLGFDHLTDELANALNPESGLPRHLLLDPKSLERVSVPQAVERVAQINAWRAEQARLADLEKMKANLTQKPYKEYEGGWRWAELPDADTPEGVKLVNDIGCQGGWCTQGESAAKSYGSHKGGNKLYALIDAEGRPHVQVQTRNKPLDENIRAAQEQFDDMWEDYVDPELVRTHEMEKIPSILQIKPFSNSWDSQMVKDFTKKNPEYRKQLEPMIQDFVRSGQWSAVGDLQNAGLRDIGQSKINSKPYHDLAEEMFPGLRYLTNEEAEKLQQEGIARTLKERGYARGGIARIAARIGKDAAPARKGIGSVIKEKGGNWLTGSVEDSLKGLKRDNLPSGVVETNPTHPNVLNQTSINSWIDKQLTRYVKNEMATPEDPVRALAERGVLHYEPALIRERSPLMEKVVGRRQTAGFPIQGLGESPLARSWENTTDSLVRNLEARDLSAAERDALMGGKKVPPETIVHEMNPFASGAGISDVGFSHLIDELSNALNTESGLPRHLLLDPSSLPRVSVPQAVERVSAINAWRAAQKAEADALRANNAATQVYKEYPENNPLGLRWVELRAPTPPEGWVQEGAAWRHPDAWKKEVAKEHPWLYPNDMLRDALKYEGDMMDHCVGKYCDDVLSGRTQIYSLRDAKGQPHVTVEVAPDSDWKNKLFEASRRGNSIEEMFGERAGEIREAFYASPFNNIQQFLEKNPQYLPQERRIVQIKGKQNRAPNPKYLPFVQDFVKSGQWSDVGDLQNTNLVKFSGGKTNIREGGHPPFENLDMPTGYMTRREAADFLEAQGVPRVLARRHVGDFEGLLDVPNYAQGGLVESMIEQNLDALVEKQTPKQMSRGGSVRTPIRAKIEKMTSELRQCRN